MVMLALIRMSSRKGGRGAIIARTMPNTAIGTPNSIQLPVRTGGKENPVPLALLPPGLAAVFPLATAGRWVLTGGRDGVAIYFFPIYCFFGCMSLKMYASTSATARYRCGGISWPTSAHLYKACASGGV